MRLYVIDHDRAHGQSAVSAELTERVLEQLQPPAPLPEATCVVVMPGLAHGRYRALPVRMSNVGPPAISATSIYNATSATTTRNGFCMVSDTRKPSPSNT